MIFRYLWRVLELHSEGVIDSIFSIRKTLHASHISHYLNIQFMKNIVLLIACFVITSISFTQQLDWAFNIGGESSDEGKALAVDQQDNVYILGFFEGTNIDFNPNPDVEHLLSSIGRNDMFLAKYDGEGEYQWAYNIGGIDLEAGHSIAVDSFGNIYITGEFYRTVDFNPDPNVENEVSSHFRSDVFVAKYDTDGNYQWAFSIGRSSWDRGNDIAVDRLGNVYVTGKFGGTDVDFDPDENQSALLASNGDDDIFVAKYDTDGNYQWAFNIGGSENDEGLGIALDKSANVYLTGNFTGLQVDFNPDETEFDTFIFRGESDIFIAKYDTDGNYQWAFGMGWSEMDEGRSIVVDKNGNVYVAGTFEGDRVDFDPGQSVVNLQSDNIYPGIFVAKYDTDGNYQWAFSYPTSSSTQGLDITTDFNDNIFLTGNFGGRVDFNPDPHESYFLFDSSPSNFLGFSDIFVVKYTSNADFLGAFKVGGIYSEIGLGIAIDKHGDISITGNFLTSDSEVDFEPSASLLDTLSSNGRTDIFVAKYLSAVFQENVTSVNSQPYGKRLKIFPNPTQDLFQIELSSSEKLEYVRIFDLHGRLLKTETGQITSISLQNLPSAIYTIAIKTNSNYYQGKIIKID